MNRTKIKPLTEVNHRQSEGQFSTLYNCYAVTKDD